MDLETKGELQQVATALVALEHLLECAFIQEESVVGGVSAIMAIINEKLENLIK